MGRPSQPRDTTRPITPPSLRLLPSTRPSQRYLRETDSSLPPIPSISHSCRPFRPFLTPSSRSSLTSPPSFHTAAASSIPTLSTSFHFSYHSPLLALPPNPSPKSQLFHPIHHLIPLFSHHSSLSYPLSKPSLRPPPSPSPFQSLLRPSRRLSGRRSFLEAPSRPSRVAWTD